MTIYEVKIHFTDFGKVPLYFKYKPTQKEVLDAIKNIKFNELVPITIIDVLKRDSFKNEFEANFIQEIEIIENTPK